MHGIRFATVHSAHLQWRTKKGSPPKRISSTREPLEVSFFLNLSSSAFAMFVLRSLYLDTRRFRSGDQFFVPVFTGENKASI